MEALVFGLIALLTINRRTQIPVPEPEEFQRFDLRTLKRSGSVSDEPPSRPIDRQPSYVAQAAS